jgi:hypothetical protein
MKNKAQITMESLLLYGAAILVVLLAIAALTYFGVLDLGRLLPDKCSFEGTGGLLCNDFQADSTTGDISVEVTNKGTKSFVISDHRFIPEDTGLTGGACAGVGNPTIVPATKTTLVYNCGAGNLPAGTRISGQFEYNYTSGGSLNHRAYGYLTVTST